jgi:hypothetical protein
MAFSCRPDLAGLSGERFPAARSSQCRERQGALGAKLGDQLAPIDPKRPCFSADGPERK